jgi:membrane dipeptidase
MSEGLATGWIDLHIDSLRAYLMPDPDPLAPAPQAQVDLPRLEQAGAIAAIWAACDDIHLSGAPGLAYVLRLLAAGRALVAGSQGRLVLVRTRADLARCSPGGPVGMLLALEGAHSLLGSLDLLEALHALGVRVLTLTWNHANPFASGCAAGAGEDRGLTPLGRELLLRARELGILLDLAHASPRTLTEALAVWRGPLLVSHTACAAIHPHRRNLSDAQMRAVADAGGLVGIMLYPPFLADATQAVSLATVARHVGHAVDAAGAAAVAMGTDFDGVTSLPEGVSGLQDLGGLRRELAVAGLDEHVIEGVMWGNARRFLQAALPGDGP